MSRRTSLDSDRFSTVSGLTSHFPSNPINVNPAPAYVAPFGASQVVSEDLTSTRLPPSGDDDDDEKLNKDDVQFTVPALALVNSFLDQLLYSFLSTARSTTLGALRPAVTEVLKHRLAREAIASAEEELAELLAGGDDEDETDTTHKAAEHGRRWDLELVWKRTRLRVMVYMRLGEMEDEDEQRYVKEDELFHGAERRFSQTSGLVSWAAAIFLTSVLEHVAEQTLQVAGQAAYTRARRQSRTQRLAGTPVRTSDDLVVEEHDVEKVALNSTLGRLWRTWRKALRNNIVPNSPSHRSSNSISRVSRENMVSAMSHRHNSSFGTAHEGSIFGGSRPMSRDQKEDPSEMLYPEHVLAANIPLPMSDRTRDIDEIMVSGLARDPDAEEEEAESDNAPYPEHVLGALVPLPLGKEKRDVDEIEVPGLARDPDAEDEKERSAKATEPKRRYSFAGATPYHNTAGLPTPEYSNASSPLEPSMPMVSRQRSSSLPTPARTPMLENRSDKVHSPDFLENDEASQDPENHMQEPVNPESSNAREITPSKSVAVDKSKTEFPWMVGGAAAASAAAASAWTLGSTRKESDNVTESSEQAQPNSQSTMKSSVSKALSGLADTANENDATGAKRNGNEGLLGLSRSALQQSRSDEEIEELDRRKSLIDIKSMMVVNSPSDPASGQDSPEKSPIRPVAPRDGSDALNRSIDSQTNANMDGTERGLGQDASNGTVGEARSADMPAAVAPGITRTSSNQEARDPAKRPARLVLGDRDAQDDSVVKQAQPLTPRTLQRQYLDLTSEVQNSDLQDGEPRPSSRPSQRASLSNGHQKSPSVGSTPFPQLSAATVEKNENEPTAHKKSNSGSLVQDHPVVQRMASLKGNDSQSPRSPRSRSASEKALPLTSASIRGPEDFDMFVQGAETVKYTLTPENVRDDPVSELMNVNEICVGAYT